MKYIHGICMIHWAFFSSWCFCCAEGLWRSVLNVPLTPVWGQKEPGFHAKGMGSEGRMGGVCVSVSCLWGRQRSRSSSCPGWVCQPSNGRDGHCRCACASHPWSFPVVSRKGTGRRLLSLFVCPSAVSCVCTDVLCEHCLHSLPGNEHSSSSPGGPGAAELLQSGCLWAPGFGSRSIFG